MQFASFSSMLVVFTALQFILFLAVFLFQRHQSNGGRNATDRKTESNLTTTPQLRH